MSTDTTTVEGQVVEATEEAPALSFKDELARYAQIDLFAKALVDYAKAGRGQVFSRMRDKAEEDGTKSFNVQIGGETVATASIAEPQGKVIVADEDALIDFVMDNYPSEVETKTVIREAFQSVLLKKVEVQDLTPEPTDDEPEPEQVLMIVDPETGAEVPGLTWKPGGEPTTFSVRWKGQPHKETVLHSLFAQAGPALGIEAGEGQ